MVTSYTGTTMSFWVKFSSFASSFAIFTGNSSLTSDHEVAYNSGTDRLEFIFLDQLGSQVSARHYIANFSTLYTTGRWYHVLYATDPDTFDDCYISHSNAGTLVETQPTLVRDVWRSDVISHDSDDFRIGANGSNAAIFNGSMFNYWWDQNLLDISSTSNRRKFIDTSGKPVDLGADGSTPTGSTPILYLEGGKYTFGQNRGAGDDLTIVGVLGSATDTPKD